MGIFHGRRATETVPADGRIVGLATIVEVRPTNERSHGDRALSLHLLVKLPGEPPFVATVKVPATMSTLSQAKRGAKVPVRVDPCDRSVGMEWAVAV